MLFFCNKMFSLINIRKVLCVDSIQISSYFARTTPTKMALVLTNFKLMAIVNDDIIYSMAYVV